MNEKHTSTNDKDSSQSKNKPKHKLIYKLYKYTYYTHSEWNTQITNEIVTCSSKHCNYKDYKYTFKSDNDRIAIDDRCPVCWEKDTLTINVRLKANVDTSVIGEVEAKKVTRSLRSKYGWIFKDLKRTNQSTESRFNGIVQFHNYNQ